MATMSSGSGVEKKVRLKCSDGEILEVEETVALESNTIKKKMEKDGHADEVIELENVSSVVMSNVMDYCKKYVEARRENKEDELKQLRTDFLQRWLMNKDGDLRSDAKYLEIKSLVEFMDQQVEEFALEQQFEPQGLPPKVKLKCSDGKILEVEKTVALESKTIEKMVEDVNANEVIGLDKVNSRVLSNIMDYCRKHVEARRENKEDKLKNWDLHFLKNCLKFHCDLDLDAKYLGIRSLVEFIDQQSELVSAAKENYKQRMKKRRKNFFRSHIVDQRMAEKQKQEKQRGKKYTSDIVNQATVSIDNKPSNEGLRHRSVRSGSGGDHEQTGPLLADQNVGASTNGRNLMHENVDEVSTNNTGGDHEQTSPLLADQNVGALTNGRNLTHENVDEVSTNNTGGDHEQTSPLLADQNVGASTNGRNLTRENVDEVSTNNTDLEKMCVIINFVLELPSTMFDQLASVHKPQYAIVSMSLSFVAMVLCIVDLIYKCRKDKVTWKWTSTLPWLYYTSEQNYGKPFGNFKDIIGLICAICQCIFATINFDFTRRHIDSPIKICFWPIVFALGLLFSKFLEKPGGRSQRIVGIP